MAVSAAIAAVSAGTALATGATVAYALTTAAIYFTATAVTKYAVEKLTPEPDMSSLDQIQGKASRGYSLAFGASGTDLPAQIVYGGAKISGLKIYEASTGDENEYLHQVYVLAKGNNQGVTAFFLNGNEVTNLENDGNVAEVFMREDGQVTDVYDGYVRILTGDFNSTLVSETSSLSSSEKWTTNHTLSGLTAVYVRYKYANEVFPTGVPTLTAAFRGIKTARWDGVTEYFTDNPAYCLYDYLTNTNYGCGIPESEIDTDSFDTVKDWLDAAGSYPDYYVGDGNAVLDESATNRLYFNTANNHRFATNGVLTTDASHLENITEICKTFMGNLTYSQGKFRVVIPFAKDLANAPVFTDDDLRSGLNVATRYSRSDLVNTISGTFSGPETNFEPSDFPKVSISSLVDDDGKVSIGEQSYSLVSTSQQATNLAKLALLRQREQIVISAKFGLKALKLNLGDVVKITNERFGFDEKPFEVLTWSLSTEQDGLIPIVEMTLKEYTDVFPNYTFVDSDVLESNNSKLLGWTSGYTQTAAEWDVVISQRPAAYANKTNYWVEIAFNQLPNSFVRFYRVVFEESATGKQYSGYTRHKQGATRNRVVVANFAKGESWTYYLSAIGSVGQTGAYTSGSFNVVGLQSLNAAISNPTITAGYEKVSLQWTPPTDSEVVGVRIYRVLSNTNTTSPAKPSTPFKVLTSDDSSWTDVIGLDIANVSGYAYVKYWIECVDYAGNSSTSDYQSSWIPLGKKIPTSTLEGIIDNDTNEIINISADNITTGTLDASNIAVTNLNASNISTGTLDASVVTVSNLSADSITGGTIDASAISVTNLNASNITGGTLDASTVSVANLNAGAITGGTIDASTVSVTNLDASNITTGTISSSVLTADNITTGTLDASAVTVSNLSANSITSGTLDASTVTVSNLSANSITSGTLDASVVTVSNLSADNITSGTLSADKIGTETISADKLVLNGTAFTVNADLNNRLEIANAGIVTSNVAAEAITNYVSDTNPACLLDKTSALQLQSNGYTADVFIQSGFSNPRGLRDYQYNSTSSTAFSLDNLTTLNNNQVAGGFYVFPYANPIRFGTAGTGEANYWDSITIRLDSYMRMYPCAVDYGYTTDDYFSVYQGYAVGDAPAHYFNMLIRFGYLTPNSRLDWTQSTNVWNAKEMQFVQKGDTYTLSRAVRLGYYQTNTFSLPVINSFKLSTTDPVRTDGEDNVAPYVLWPCYYIQSNNATNAAYGKLHFLDVEMCDYQLFKR